MGALYRDNVTIFDNMPFELAATLAHQLAEIGDTLGINLTNDFYNGLTPWDPLIASNLQEGYAVTGEFLGAFRGTQSTPVTYLDSHAGLEAPWKLHSQALLTMLLFADTEVHVDWTSIGADLTTALFDREVAQNAGFDPKGTNGHYDEEYKQLAAIAYSAIDEGTLVFGNTGIRAFYEDADELGKLVSEGKVPTAHADPISGLSQAIVQFAGQMALNKVDSTDHPSIKPEEGFLSTYNSNGRDYLKADLTKALWNLGGADPNKDLDIKGIQTILDSFFSTEGEASEMLDAMQVLYGSDKTSTIERIDFALGSGDLTVELAERLDQTIPYNPDSTSLFVGLDGADNIDGNSDNNMVVGGEGDDTLYGGIGKDIIVGGTGNDRIVDVVTEAAADGRSNEDDIYFGEPSGGQSDDTVEYRLTDERDPTAVLPAQGVSISSLTLTTLANADAVELAITDLNSGKTGTDYLVDIDTVILSERREDVTVAQAWLDADLELDLGKAGGGAEITFTKADYDRASFAGFSQGTITENGVTRVGDSALGVSGAEELVLTEAQDRFSDTMRFGKIDDVRELFGSPTTSGFDELAEHDLNADGLIDVNDAIFSDLRVWQDLNQNAKVDAGELSTLTEAGIESISLTATASNQTNANNLIAEVGSFTRTDSTTSDIADVKFKINNYDSKWLGDSTVDPTVGAHEKVRLVNSAKLAA